MKIGNTRAVCKKGIHGMTKHGIYSYDGHITTQCLECTKDRKAARQANKEKNEHDKEYSKQWNRLNRGKYRQRAAEKRIKEQKERKARINKYLAEKKPEIIHILATMQSSLTFNDIKKHCYRFNTTSIHKIKRLIINNKKSQLLDREQYMQSYVVKYAWGVAGNGFNYYSHLPEQTKEKIRTEYKDKAKEIVNKKMAELCANI